MPCERNGSYRHGLHNREAIAERKALQALVRGLRGVLSALDATSGAKPLRAFMTFMASHCPIPWRRWCPLLERVGDSAPRRMS